MTDDIHAAKLPSHRPLADLLIHATPDGSVETTPDVAGWRYLSFRVFTLDPGESAELARTGCEAACVAISGSFEIETADGTRLKVPGRKSAFESLPWAVYLPHSEGSRVTAIARGADPRVTIAVGYAPRSSFDRDVSDVPIMIGPTDVELELRGSGRASRQVNNIIMPSFSADRLLVCEVLTPGGNWSGWPPHRHDFDDMPREAVLEETYYYRFRRPEAWAVARIYFRDGRDDALWAVRDSDLLQVTEGYHPFSATVGYDAYYLNVLAGDRRTMTAADDPDLAWIRDTWNIADRDPRLPLVDREPPT